MAKKTKLVIRKYGYISDLRDHRDYKLAKPTVTPILPTSVDLRQGMPEVQDQLSLSACTAFAAAAAFQYELQKDTKHKNEDLSKLFLYFCTRDAENATTSDTGGQIRDAVKCLNKQGICTTDFWQYDETKVFERPGDAAYQDASHFKVGEYIGVNVKLNAIKQVLANGFPIIFGTTIFSSFEGKKVEKNGKVPYPKKEEKMLGGHAMCIVGYDDVKRIFIVQNSWGVVWGDEGYCYMPYKYVANPALSDDFWFIKSIGVS
jgi:C1A family cysteine protease